MLYLLLNSLKWALPTNTSLYDIHIEDFDVDSSYIDELKRESSGNSFKLNIEIVVQDCNQHMVVLAYIFKRAILNAVKPRLTL